MPWQLYAGATKGQGRMTQDEFGYVVGRLFAPVKAAAYTEGASDALVELKMYLATAPKPMYSASEIEAIIERQASSYLEAKASVGVEQAMSELGIHEVPKDRVDLAPLFTEAEAGRCVRETCQASFKWVQQHYTPYSDTQRVYVLCESCWEGLPPAMRLKYYGRFQNDPIWPAVKAAVLEGK